MFACAVMCSTNFFVCISKTQNSEVCFAAISYFLINKIKKTLATVIVAPRELTSRGLLKRMKKKQLKEREITQSSK